MFIALKPCRFDRDYLIGEQIPDEAIIPSEVQRLISYGLITGTHGSTQQPQDGDNGQGGDNVPPVTTEGSEGENKPITEAQLSKLTKPQLLETAKAFELELDPKMTNPEMVRAILLAQETTQQPQDGDNGQGGDNVPPVTTEGSEGENGGA